MRRAAVTLAALSLVWLGAASEARAQMPASALGKPLPDGNLDVGTMTVAVFDGSPTEPLVGLVVTLAGEGDETRSARTDARGRAAFKGLPPGTTWVAQVEHEEETTQSDPIPIPDEGGVKVALSPAPWAAAPAATGDGRPPPHQMTSIPRPERGMQPGSLQVRILDGTWNKPVPDHLVHLIGLRADGGLIRKKGKTDGSGRVMFTNLRGSDVGYYVLTMLDGPGGTDQRLMSRPVQLLPGVGSVMVLTGAAPAADEPRDDLHEIYRDQVAPPEGPGPGKVEIRVGGSREILDRAGEVELIEVSSPEVVAKSPLRSSDAVVEGQFVVQPRPDPDKRRPPGHAIIGVVRPIRGTPPVKGAKVELLPTGGTEPIVRETDRTGRAEISGLQKGVEYTATVELFGKRIESEPFTMPEDAAIVGAVALNWESNVKAATFSALPWGPDKVYVAQLRSGELVHRTPPFQLTRQMGAVVPLPLWGRPLFSFHAGGMINDEYLAFEGTFSITNGPFQPFSVGENVMIPLPRGFVGAQVEERYQDRVKVVDGKGLLWKGAVPPGGMEFQVGFAVKTDDGVATLDWDLPYGAFDSNLMFQWAEGMDVSVVGRAQGQVIDRDGRQFYVMRGINIQPQKSIAMKVSGLPQQPAWRDWVEIGIGVVVILLIGVSIAVIFIGRRGRKESAEARERRERLLDELAELERRRRDGEIAEGKYKKGRKKLLSSLEPLYEQQGG